MFSRTNSSFSCTSTKIKNTEYRSNIIINLICHRFRILLKFLNSYWDLTILFIACNFYHYILVLYNLAHINPRNHHYGLCFTIIIYSTYYFLLLKSVKLNIMTPFCLLPSIICLVCLSFRFQFLCIILCLLYTVHNWTSWKKLSSNPACKR